VSDPPGLTTSVGPQELAEVSSGQDSDNNSSDNFYGPEQGKNSQ
jgi:hypothetical protein